jgi:hypothetical protein
VARRRAPPLTRDMGSLPDRLGTRHGRRPDGAQPEHRPK